MDRKDNQKGGLAPDRQRSNCGVGVLMNLDGEKSHGIIEDGFEVLESLDHRGARGSEEDTGDGAGVLIQKPHAFFEKHVSGLPEFDGYGVGQLYLPRDPEARREVKSILEKKAESEGFDVLGWRDVPTDNSSLGPTAVETEPDVRQFFVEPRQDLEPKEIDRQLYVLRRVIEKTVENSDVRDTDRFYICSLDRRKIVYKGLLTNHQVRKYYPDLSEPEVKSSLVLVHSRFSTNTLGAWELAHPYRNIIHNGEINTLRGNLNWMKARENDLSDSRFGEKIEKIKPVTDEDQSDTAVIDNVLELLVEGGRDPEHALRMLIPEAWSKDDLMSEERREWYDYHSSIVEPWDGPALVAFTDGYSVGAVLDRNGLRPCRYYVTEDDRLVMASEAGVLDIPDSEVVKKDRLKPGEMFLADAEEGRIVPDEEVFADLTDDKYGRWLDENRLELGDLEVDEVPDVENDDLEHLHRAFGYTRDHIDEFLQPMSEKSKDPVGSMGDDTPPSALSDRNKTLFTYFKQLFAQVSNPPIDHIREELVTSLESHIGGQKNLLDESPEHCRQLKLGSPLLDDGEMSRVRDVDANGMSSAEIDVTYRKNEKTLREAVEEIRGKARRAVEDGKDVLILSDRDVDEGRVPIPSLLAVAAVHHHLIREGLRTRTGIVLESGQPNSVHHFCTLIGYGADAVNPYLALETVRRHAREDRIDAGVEEGVTSYLDAAEGGLKKVMSKMGISTLESYKGAQVFEAVGLNSDFVEEYFYGTTARTEGVGIDEIEDDLLDRHEAGFGDTEGLDPGGEIKWKREGEYHSWNSKTVRSLQIAVRQGDYQKYQEFSRMVDHQNEQLHNLRGLLDIDNARDPIPVEEVESVEKLVKRFFTASMSFGSLSEEAHETLAQAMNQVGAKSGSGEGGEPVYRFDSSKRSKLKQVASGRFGVTARYLNDADEIEIKMAQGSKPGEGGHLPGSKVNETIAETRHTTPGVSLISPPPHHDIYSIEDLAQLIHDLKCSNRDADVHVKLVSEAGVGVIAAGVAKAKADAVLISGASGGTGASPKTSIKSTGLPWELGIAEANQVLLENDLRSRIKMRVDGGLKTGRDVAVAALLGAEEYGFGTAALVSEGCVMVRKCHENNCPTGIATQDPERRKQFNGEPEHVVNYVKFVARELRETMAELGYRKLDEMIGDVDSLKHQEMDDDRADSLDLSGLLYRPETDQPGIKVEEQSHDIYDKLDEEIIERIEDEAETGNAPSPAEDVELSTPISNEDRSIGAVLSSWIVENYGDSLEGGSVKVNFTGSAGQSFGAFLESGVTFKLTGDANDYVGKGLSGGKIIASTPGEAKYEEDGNIIVGNVGLYGATDGEAYFNGVAGERFGVRNSGVKAVVEGCGDHGCEYMTGGAVVVLGDTGRNFAAGMSGGEAYVLDEEGDFTDKVNCGMVHLEELDDRDMTMVRRMVENHVRYTDSEKGNEVLDNWSEYRDKFVKVMPDAFAEVVEERMAEDGVDIRLDPPSRPEEEVRSGQSVMGDD